MFAVAFSKNPIFFDNIVTEGGRARMFSETVLYHLIIFVITPGTELIKISLNLRFHFWTLIAVINFSNHKIFAMISILYLF